MPDLRAVILSAAVDFVRRQVPYGWGRADANITDCSGLVVQCYRAAGIDIGRTTWDQIDACYEISEAQALPGDLVFFDVTGPTDHVGIVSRRGYMINAPSEGKLVTEEPIWTAYPLTYARHPALDGPTGEPALVYAGTVDDPIYLRGGPSTANVVKVLIPSGTTVLLGEIAGTGEHVWREGACIVGGKLYTGFLAADLLKGA